MSGHGGAINVVGSHDLEALLHEFASALADPGASADALDRAFEPEIVVVPSSTTRNYLKRALARHLGATGNGDGIVANIVFVEPRQVACAQVGDNGTGVHDLLGLGTGRWDLAPLTWKVDHALRTLSPPQVSAFASAPLSSARRVAQLFDHYISHRPEMLREWLEPGDGAGTGTRTIGASQMWQVEVFRHVYALMQPSPELAVLSPDSWADGISRADASSLPRRVSVFGVTGLSRAVRDLLGTLSRHVEVTAYVVHAASANWPALRPHDDETQTDYATRVALTVGTAGRHPLHSRWCSSSIEQAALLGTEPRLADGLTFDRSTLLSKLQDDIVNDRSTGTVRLNDPSTETTLATGDGSVQVHACFGSVRQAEALRDSILRLLRDEESLRLRDIVIACADPTAAAPVLSAVFDPRLGATDAVTLPAMPISVTGGGTSGLRPLAEAFLGVLRLATSRCSPGEIIKVLSLEHVSRCFGLDRESLETIADWAEATGVRHGIDPSHRTAVTGVPGSVSATTWLEALRRVALGAAVPSAHGETGPGDLVPVDSVSSAELAVFGALAEFMARLGGLADTFSHGTLTVAEWTATVQTVLVDFLAADDDDAPELARIQEAIVDDLRHGNSIDNPVAVHLPVTDLIQNLATHLPSEFSPYSVRGESITLTTLAGIAHQPRRIVAVFGANEELFSGAPADGDDILANTPLAGEPNYSMAGRQVFLHALMAARTAFLVTCDWRDISNNKTVPFAVPVQELLEVVAATIRHEPVGATHRTLVLHPRQNYQDQTMTPGAITAGEPFTFDPSAPAANGTARRAKTDGAGTLPAPAAPKVPVVAPVVVSLRDIAEAVRNPLAFHVKDILNVDLPAKESSTEFGSKPITGDGIIPLDLDGLAESAEGRDLLNQLASDKNGSPTSVISSWQKRRPAAGSLPPGRAGEAFAEMIAAEMREMVDLLPSSLRDLTATEDRDVEVSVGGVAVTGRVQSVSTVPNEDAIVRLRFKRYDDTILLAPWIDLAMLTVADGGNTGFEAHVIARGAKSGAPPVATVLKIAGDDARERLTHATEVIRIASGIHYVASREHVPIFEKASRERAKKGRTVPAAFEKDLERSADIELLLDGRSFDEVQAEQVTALDRQALGANDGAGRFDFYADLLWGTFEETCMIVGEMKGGGDGN